MCDVREKTDTAAAFLEGQGAPATRILQQTRLLVPMRYQSSRFHKAHRSAYQLALIAGTLGGCAVLCGKSSQPTKLGVD